MGKKLTGQLMLSRIPKDLVQVNAKGEKFIWIDILRKDTPDQYGQVATITTYNKNEKKSIYLSNLKEVEFGKKEDPAPTPAPAQESDDLPF